MKLSSSAPLVLAVMLLGCSSSRVEIEEGGKEGEGLFELYSLEPIGEDPGFVTEGDPYDSSKLYGWPILGKTTVRYESTRKQLMDILNDGPKQGSKCFSPRH